MVCLRYYGYGLLALLWLLYIGSYKMVYLRYYGYYMVYLRYYGYYI